MHELTSQEKFFLKYLALPDKEVAELTGYALNTYKTYKMRIYRRLNASTATHALFKAVQKGIISIEDIVV